MNEELLKDITNPETGLTEKEDYFLSILFDECGGDVGSAMDKAGLSKSTTPTAIRRKFKDHIQKMTKDYLAFSTGEAAIKLVSVLRDPSAMGAKNIIAASKEVLDRGGVFKEETIQATTEQNIFILPAKDSEEE